MHTMQLIAYYYIHTYTFIRLTAFFSRTTWVSRHQKGKPFWILLKQEMMGGSAISWTICKSFAPHSSQITMPVPHHSVFYGLDALLMPNQQCQSTVITDCHLIAAVCQHELKSIIIIIIIIILIKFIIYINQSQLSV